MMSAEGAADAADPAQEMSQEELDKEMAKIHEEIEKLRREHDEVRGRGACARACRRACLATAELVGWGRHVPIMFATVRGRQVFTNGDKDSDKVLSPEEFYAVQKEDDPEADQVEARCT